MLGILKIYLYMPKYSGNARVHGIHPDWTKSK